MDDLMRAIKANDELEMRRVLDTHSNLRSQLRRQDYFAASEPSPLHEAVEDGKHELVLIMTRDFRVHPNSLQKLTSGGQMTPLHVAALSQHPDCARVLVAHGADENIVCKFSRDYKGTPRDFAEQHLEVCKDLMHRDREVIAVLDKSVHKREKKISASQQGGGHFLPSVGGSSRSNSISRKNSRVSVSRKYY